MIWAIISVNNKQKQQSLKYQLSMVTNFKATLKKKLNHISLSRNHSKGQIRTNSLEYLFQMTRPLQNINCSFCFSNTEFETVSALSRDKSQ